MARFDREASPLALDQGRPGFTAAHQSREAAAVERRRHRHQLQVGPQPGLDVERQRHSEIAVQAAFVHLVEQHSRHPFQARVGLDAAEENAFGQHQDAGGRGSLRVQPRRIADGSPDGLAGQLGHPLGRGAGREAARREEQYLAAAPGLGEQSRGDGRGLAGAGRGDEHRVRPGAQGRQQVGEHALYGESQ
jgi:hypothetical protein